MEEIIALIRSFESFLSLTTFAFLLLATIIAYSRSSTIYGVWEEAVETGRLRKMSQSDLLQPWLVRIYQRSRTYRNFANIILLISITIVIQVLYRATPSNSAMAQILTIIRVMSILFTNIALVLNIFSVQIGLRAELRDLNKRFPEYDIKLEHLISLHEADKYFVVESIPKK